MTLLSEFVIWGIVTLVGAFVGSYLAGYLKKKGENLATHEDIGKLVEQMKAVTQATKEIEATISDKAWSRQRQWEMKRDAIFSVMDALGRADETLHTLPSIIQNEKKFGDPFKAVQVIQKAWDVFNREIDNFDFKRSLALIVCGKEMNDTLFVLKHELRSIASKIADGDSTAYDNQAPKLQPYFAKAFALARRELGIERETNLVMPQSCESATAPSSGSQDPQ
jgi:hypothetical protein